MRKFIRVLGICYLVYLAIVLVIITPALNFLPAWAVEKYLGRQLQSEFTYFNPFTLSLEVGKTEMLDVPNGSQIWRMDFNVTGTVLACSGDIGTVLMYKSDFNGRFKCVSEVSPKTVQKNSDNSYSNSR